MHESPYDDRHLRPVSDEPAGGDRALPVHTNPPAEMAVLGAILLHPEIAEQIHPELEPDDFWRPAHETVWDAIHAVVAAGLRPDPVTVGTHLNTQGDLARIGGATYLHDLMAACPMPTQAAAYAADVRNASRLRKASQSLTRAQQVLSRGHLDGADEALQRAQAEVDEATLRFDGRAATTAPRVPNIKEFLKHEGDPYDWLIPGLLERQDRVILTGGEGSGKSTLGRQVAVTCAAGLHPFSLTKITPLRVLVIDFENPKKLVQRAFENLHAKVERELDPDNLSVVVRTSGIDLLTKEDRDWMTAGVRSWKPDLLVTGPHYKMTAGDTDKEKESKPVALYLDQLREEHGCAVWLEAHVGNENQGSRHRPERPFGWSGWRRWPEFGLYLAPDGQLKHWRGDRDERDWPATITRGRTWPWESTLDEIEIRWHAIKKARHDAGEYLSYKDLTAATGYDKNQIARTIGKGQRHVFDWNVLNGKNPYATGIPDEEPW